MIMIEKKPSLIPILEPLCTATGQILKPLPLFESDFLEIDVDEEIRHFIVEPMTLVPYDEYEHDDKKPIDLPDRQYVRMDRQPSWNAVSKWLYRIPERKQISYTRWRLAGTDFTAIIIYHIWPQDKIVWKKPEAKLLFDFLIKRFRSQANSAIVAANFKVNKLVPKMPAEYVEHPDLPLVDYQKVGLMTTYNQEASALFMEQGTGKTPIVVARVNLEGRQKKSGKLPGAKQGMYRSLILCPQQVRKNWESEFERFSTVPGKITVLRGGQLRRVHGLIDSIRTEDDCEWSATVMSIDSAASTYEALKKVPWDLVVVDESHYIKGHSTQRFKTIKQFNGPNVRSRMILTGTPIANTPMDLWPQFEFLGEGLSGFLTFKNFRSFHGRYVNAGGSSSVQKLVSISGIPLIQERLARIAFMIRKDEALNLPPKVYDIYEVKMTKVQAEWYNKMANELAVEIENLDEKRMTVDHILTMLLRLAQITSGHVKWDTNYTDEGEESGGEVQQIPGENPKITAILELLQDPEHDKNSKTIIWACFVEDIRAVSEALAKAGIKHVGYHKVIKDEFRVVGADKAEEIYNEDEKCMVLIANPASGGTGQNFLGYNFKKPEGYETYTGHEIFMSCNWSAVQRSQAEDRAHRRGTKMPVRITDLVIPGTIDEEIRARLLQKRTMALQIQDVRAMLKRILSAEVIAENGD